MWDMTTCAFLHALVRMGDMTHAVCGMTYSYVRYDSFKCVIRLIHLCNMTRSYSWHYNLGLAARTDIYVGHDSFIWDMARLYVGHDSFIYTTWVLLRVLVSMWDMTHSYATWLVYMRHDSLIYTTWVLLHVLVSMWDMVYSFERYHVPQFIRGDRRWMSHDS